MPIVTAAIVDLSYQSSDHVSVSLFCRTDTGSLIVIKDFYRPYFLLLPRPGFDVMDLRVKLAKLSLSPYQKVSATILETKNFKSEELSFIKVFVSTPDAIREIVSIVQEWESVMGVYEYDISLTRKYLLDNNLVPLSLFECETAATDEVINGIPVFKMIRLIARDIDFIQPIISSITFDLQVDLTSGDNQSLTHSEISNIVLVTGTGTVSRVTTHVFTCLDQTLHNPDIIYCQSEAEIITRFRDVILEIKPDLLLFEHSSRSLRFLLERARILGIDFSINFDQTVPFFNSISKRFRTTGCNEVFVHKILEHSYGSPDADIEVMYAKVLDSIAVAAFIESESSAAQQLQVLYRKSFLNLSVCVKIFSQLTELFKLAGLRIADTLSFSLPTLIEWMLIRRSTMSNTVIPDKLRDDDMYTPRAASYPVDMFSSIVPLPGIYSPVIMADFSLVYTDCVIQQNLSLDSYECECCKTLFCQKKKGIVTSLILDLQARLSRIKEVSLQAPSVSLDYRQAVLEKILGSFYEYLQSPYYRWYSPAVHDVLVTSVKQNLQIIVDHFNTNNRVLYVSDSIMYVHMHQDVSQSIQKLYEGHPEISWFSLKKIYPKAIFLSRDESKAKRLRAVFLDSESYSNPLISTGILRRHHPTFVKKTIIGVCTAILEEKPRTYIIDYLRQIIADLHAYSYSIEDVTLSIRLLQSPEEYKDHTALRTIIKALQQKKYDVRKGSIISYVICEGDELYADRATLPADMDGKKYDARYYANKILITAVTDLLAIVGITPEEVIDGKAQSSLSSFM